MLPHVQHQLVAADEHQWSSKRERGDGLIKSACQPHQPATLPQSCARNTAASSSAARSLALSVLEAWQLAGESRYCGKVELLHLKNLHGLLVHTFLGSLRHVDSVRIEALAGGVVAHTGAVEYASGHCVRQPIFTTA